jgi:hypothetical protein
MQKLLKNDAILKCKKYYLMNNNCGKQSLSRRIFAPMYFNSVNRCALLEISLAPSKTAKKRHAEQSPPQLEN